MEKLFIQSYLILAYLHNPKIKARFINPMVVNLYKACLMEGMMMAPTSSRILVKITISLLTNLSNNSHEPSLVIFS